MALAAQKELELDTSLDSNQEAYMVREMKKFFKSKIFLTGNKLYKIVKEEAKKIGKMLYCDKKGHILENCPKPKNIIKEKGKDKAPTKPKQRNLKAIWDDFSKDSKSKQTASLTFMAIPNDKEA